MSAENLGTYARRRMTDWRQLLATVSPGAPRLTVFAKAADDVAGLVEQGLDRTVAADELYEMAQAYDVASDIDEIQRIVADAFARIRERDRVPDLDAPAPEKTNGKQRGQSPKLRILSKAEFIADFEPPDYLVDGMLQRRFIYSLTGPTGHAKTAIALLLAELVSAPPDRNVMFGTHHVEKGRVVYFVGENADDLRMRVIGADSKRKDDPARDCIHFIEGVFNINEMFEAIAKHIGQLGGSDLIIIDTSAAYFLGQDENINPQIGAHARMLRQLTSLPGRPCVLVLCHPIKHAAEPSQLLPRGGGAFLAEMDGNLTAWKHDDVLIRLHHTKMRGAGFEPMTFEIDRIMTPNLVDSKSRMIPTVRAVAISQSDETRQQDKAEDEERCVLVTYLGAPVDTVLSFSQVATALDWRSGSGEPYKSRVQRVVDRLKDQKPAVLHKRRDEKYELTDYGKKLAREYSLLFQRQKACAAEAARQTDFDL